MEFSSVGEALRTHWASLKVEMNAGLSESAIREFEADYGVTLPADMRDYFLCVNGMPRYAVDSEMIRFWTLEEVKPLSNGAPAFADSDYIESSESLFLFADYSIWAHAYAIRLTKLTQQKNMVFIVGGESPHLLCNSFSEFVDRYLTNKDLLFS